MSSFQLSSKSQNEINQKNMKKIINDVDADIIWTPYYRTMVNDTLVGCQDEPKFIYTSYILFCLSTHLLAWSNKYLDPSFNFQFPTKEKNGKMYITIVPTKGNDQIEITPDLKTKVTAQLEKLTSKYKLDVVLFTDDNFLSQNGFLIPSPWIRQMLPYLNIKKELNPHYVDGSLLVELDNIIDYDILYKNLVINITETLENMFTQGYVFSPSDEIITKWHLVPIDNNHHLYKPTWTDYRIIQNYFTMNGFLLSRINGDTYINFFVGYKWLYRHQVAKSLVLLGYDFIFYDQYVRVYVNDLQSSQQAASQIDYSIKTGEGKVLNINVTRKSWIILYTKIASNMGFPDCTGYKILDNHQPYIFSCKIPFDNDINFISNKIHDESIKKIEGLEKNIIFDPDITSIHDLIETQNKLI